jgi:hypothetical protein
MRRRGCILPSTRVVGIALLVLLWLLMTVPSTAAASLRTPPTKEAAIPNCASLSRTAMASLAGTGPLTVLKITGPYCAFISRIAGHYRPTLDVGILPYSKALWKAATSVHPTGATVGYANPKLFFWASTVTSESAGNTSACQSDQVVVNEVGPECAGQPTQDAFGAAGYGSYIVTVDLSGQLGDVHLSHVLAMVMQILSGKIH